MTMLAWVLLTGVIAIGGVVACEMIARVALRNTLWRVWAPGLRLEMALDRDALPELPPVAHFRVNRDGERGPEAPRGDGVYRVLVAGGSAVECKLLDQGDTWSAVVGRHLARPDALAALHTERVHVGNIGKSQVDSASLVRILERVLPQYPPLDALIVMTGGTNLIRFMETGGHPGEALAAVSDADLFDRAPTGEYTWSIKGCAIREVAKRARDLHGPVQRRDRVGARIARARAQRAAATNVIHAVPDTTKLLDDYEEDLLAIWALGRRHARRVVFVRQSWFEKASYTPEELAHFWTGAVGDPLHEKVSTYYALEVASEIMRRLDERLITVAGMLEAEVVALMPRLEPSLTNYYDRMHYNREGARRVGEMVAEAVLAGAATAGALPASTSRAASLERTA